MTCHSAFLDKNGIELLEDHLRATLSWVRRLFISRRYHLRLARILDVEEGTARVALELSALVHDLGKGVERYQTSRTGFRGHEYFSAFLATRSLRLPEQIVASVGLAILLHHHTMQQRDPPRGRHRLSEECVKTFLRLADSEGLADLLDPQPLRAEFTTKDVIAEAKRLKTSGRVNPLPALALLYPLVIADNLAASARGGGRTVLLNEIIQSYVLRGPL